MSEENNYEEKIEEFMQFFYEDWMTDDEKKMFLNIFFQRFCPKEHFINLLKIGEQNGYSIETQFDLFKDAVGKLKACWSK